MNLLAIDTSSSACSVGLLLNNEIKIIHEIAPLQQAQKILPMIERILGEANISLNQLDGLAFGCGPGSFTGVRIATSVMQGIGYAMNLPLIPVSSLAALAQAAYHDLGWKKLLTAIDARIQEVYWGAYEVNAEGLVELINKEVVCPPEGICLPNNQKWYGIGNAWEIYSGQISVKPVALDVSRLPTALGVLQLAKARYEKKDWVDAENALPSYLRNEVALKKK
jgi:tRNA threonylcarbamoyladenosine biosynthesis protein TsaB